VEVEHEAVVEDVLHVVAVAVAAAFHSGPENFKKSGQKNS